MSVIRMPMANPRPKVSWPALTFSRYERTPKNTSSSESTIAVYPRMYDLVESIESWKSRVACMVTVATAPEIRPKVRMVFFIGISPFVNGLLPAL
jgi:hypothetical protein